jgi:hypothetical protein
MALGRIPWVLMIRGVLVGDRLWSARATPAPATSLHRLVAWPHDTIHQREGALPVTASRGARPVLAWQDEHHTYRPIEGKIFRITPWG